MSDKLFIKGTLILTLTGLVSRLMGFFYRIFLSHDYWCTGSGNLPAYASGSRNRTGSLLYGHSGCYFQAVCLFHCPWKRKRVQRCVASWNISFDGTLRTFIFSGLLECRFCGFCLVKRAAYCGSASYSCL